MAYAYEWDPRKEARNRAKHGVSFVEAASVFLDPMAKTTLDPRTEFHAEPRYHTIGWSLQGRLLIVANCVAAR